MNKRLLIGVTLVTLALTLTGCEDLEFGDKIEDFVNDEVNGLSRTLVTTELKKGWSSSFQEGYTTATARLKFTAAEAARIEAPEAAKALSLDEALSLLSRSDQASAILANMERDVAETVNRVDGLVRACESRALFLQMNLDKTAVNLVWKVSAPKKNFFASVDYNNDIMRANETVGLAVLAGRFLQKTIFSFKYNEQRKKAEYAVRSIPSKVITSEEIFLISQRECSAVRSLYHDNIQLLRGTAGKLIEALGLRRAVQLAWRRRAELKITTASLAEVSESTGYANLLASVAKGNFQSDLKLSLPRSLEELRSLRLEAKNQSGCFTKLRAREEYEDATKELEAVLASVSGESLPKPLAQELARTGALLAQEKMLARGETALHGVCQ